MSVIFRPEGDILESGLQAIAIPVNCVGVAGKGLAKQAALAYPDWVMNYIAACKNSKVNVDKKPYIQTRVTNPKYMISFPTKREWWNPSQLIWIQHGLEWIADNGVAHGINELGLPMLGCGEGGLEWSQVRPLILSYFENHDIAVTVFGE
jgi:O-acetyl-ADP-ribose deacetylase (regulator of RNase III)